MQEARSVAFVACGLAYASASLLVGCNAFDPGVLDRLQSPIESPRDAGPRDAGSLKPPCTIGFELCNGKDDDCDDEIDENADVACVQPHAMTVCATGGRCVRLECDPGWSDCNRTPSDGCEYDEAENGPCPTCTGPDCEPPPMDAGDEPDAEAPEEDAAIDAEVDAGPTPDACVAAAEACDGADNDCDDKVDETAECEIQRCAATTPSYRGAECDRCVCEKCEALLDLCQYHPDATWREQCRDVAECYVVEDRAGNCVPAGNCYGTGGGPCAGEINLASGGESEDDGSQAAAGCAPMTPPTTACMAVTNYRDQCINDLCADACN